MIAALLRLFALRPILAGSLLGIPVLMLILLGLATALFLKLLLVAVPVIAVFWLVRRFLRTTQAEPVQTL
ncbi:MAG: hypothetical protein IT355_02435 [Gemmatimonadaceae bacterium]|nr:hypothetical protein [Gemmatimonadaceae bacterium]